MNEKIKQPTLEELCKYFWELAKKYALTEKGKKEIPSVEFILKSEMLMNRVGTIETELNELKEFARLMCSGADIYAHCIDFEYTTFDYDDKNFDLVKKEVEKYGN